MSEPFKYLTENAQLENLVLKTAHGASYMGGGATVACGLTLNEWGVIVGMCFTALTYVTFLYFKIKQDRREERAVSNSKNL